MLALSELSLACFAQHVSDVEKYLRPIVSAQCENGGGSWRWEIAGNGGYLVRALVDVNGDGRDVLFLTSSLTSGRYIAEWIVFDVSQTGVVKEYLSRLQFPVSSVWVAGSSGLAELVYLGVPDREMQTNLPQEQWRHPIYKFSFSFPTILENRFEISDSDARKIKSTASYKALTFEAVLLADFLSEVDVKWVQVSEWKTDAADSFFVPDLHRRAKSNVTFTPQIALSKLGLAMDASLILRRASSGVQSEPMPRGSVANQNGGGGDQSPTYRESPSRLFLALGIIAIISSALIIRLVVKWRRAKRAKQ